MCIFPPVYSAICISLLTIKSSATEGMGGKPNNVEFNPSFIAPPARVLSSQCSMTVKSYICEYSKTFLNIDADLIAIPSSEKPTAPASNNSAIGESTSPSLPTVAAAIGKTSTR